jgi:hypothetical protein
MDVYFHSKTQHTTVAYSQKISKHVTDLYDPADKYYRDMLRKNVWEEISAII